MAEVTRVVRTAEIHLPVVERVMWLTIGTNLETDLGTEEGTTMIALETKMIK